jgi:hypothetical protein
MRDPNTSESSVGGPPGSHGASSINAAADAIKAGHPSPELAEAIQRGYEPHDINLRGIWIFGVVLVVTIIVALILVAGIMKGMLVYERAVDPMSSPVTIDKAPPLIPLQPSVEHDQFDSQDMEQMRSHVQMILSGSGQHGDRRWIPIDQAMDQVLPMLPIGAASGAPPAGGTSRGTSPAGGSASASNAAGWQGFGQ